MSVALLVLPDFMLVALGWALRHKLGFSREFFAGAERLVYFVLFPALLFQAILRTPISAGNAALLLQATAAMIAVGVALSWLAGPCCGPPRSGWRPPRNAATASTPTSAWRCRPASAARRGRPSWR